MCQSDSDGGYYAIKGFLYQFDRTIIEILNNEDKETNFEYVQDINSEDYVIQVKHKETQNFTNSKIKSPVIQLLRLFENDWSKKYCLYCYFADKSPVEWILQSSYELDSILGNKKDDFDTSLKERFVKNFVIKFCEDFESQFDETIDKIFLTFRLPSREEAVIYHAMIRSFLLDLATKDRYMRKVSLSVLERNINRDRKVIFYSRYKEYLGQDKFYKFIKREYFTHSKANINNYERLFIIDDDEDTNTTDLIEIVKLLSDRYFRLDKSPAPYISFRSSAEKILKLKQSLIDCNLHFCDGTCFNGDIFRIDKLTEGATSTNGIKVKFINEKQLRTLMEHVEFKEIYHFFQSDYISIESTFRQTVVQLEQCKDIIKILRG